MARFGRDGNGNLFEIGSGAVVAQDRSPRSRSRSGREPRIRGRRPRDGEPHDWSAINRVRKAAGIDGSGEVVIPDTPGAWARPPGSKGSKLPQVAASRQLLTDADEWVDLQQAGAVVDPPVDPNLLLAAYLESSILPPCITAMAVNVTGFGWDLVPKWATRDEQGNKLDAPGDADEQRDRLELWMQALNLVSGVEGMTEQADDDRHTIGNAYLELLRDTTGVPVSLENVPGSSMRIGHASAPIQVDIQVAHPRTREVVTVRRYMRFRPYVQRVGQRTVWFKAYGDPRHMNRATGELRNEPWGKDESGNSLEATEIVHIANPGPHHSPYGLPVWFGAMEWVRTSRGVAELLATWLADAPIGTKVAFLAGGTWRPNQQDELEDAIEDRTKGIENAFSVVLVEATVDSGGDLDEGGTTSAKLIFEDLASEPPKGVGNGDMVELADDQVMRTFRLPPIYVGRSSDYNRATSKEARAVTEEQVMEPDRRPWHHLFNRRLLPELGITWWQMRYRGASTTDDGDTAKSVAGIVQGGGASPNQLIMLLNKITGQTQETHTEAWGDRPLSMTMALIAAGKDPNAELSELAQPSPVDGADETSDTESDAAPAGDSRAAEVKAVALNGAQLKEAREIALSVARGELPAASGIAMLESLLRLQPAEASAILSSIDAGALEPDDEDDELDQSELAAKSYTAVIVTKRSAALRRREVSVPPDLFAVAQRLHDLQTATKAALDAADERVVADAAADAGMFV